MDIFATVELHKELWSGQKHSLLKVECDNLLGRWAESIYKSLRVSEIIARKSLNVTLLLI